MNKTKLILISALLANSLSPAFAISGFFKTSEPWIPEAVRANESAVFRLVFFNSKPQAVVKKEDYDFIINKYQNTSFQGRLYVETINDCIANNKDSCPVYFTGHATGFLARDRQTLWCNYHSFDDQIAAVTDLASFKAIESTHRRNQIRLGIRPRMLVYDSHDRLVFDSRKREDAAHFEFLGTTDSIPKSSLHTSDATIHDLANRYTDIAVVHLSRPIGDKVLKFALRRPAPGQGVFMFGYAPKTEREFPTPSSDGNGLWATAGVVLTWADYYQRLYGRPSDITPAAEERAALDVFVLNDADGAHGMSGAPIFNRSGEVISLFMSTASKADQYHRSGNLGVRIDFFDQFIPKKVVKKF